METVGSIFDKLSILEKRMRSINEKINNLNLDLELKSNVSINNLDKTLVQLNNQRGWLIRELGRIIVSIGNKERPAIFKKHKVYDKDVKEDRTSDLLSLILLLDIVNGNLWGLEDKRRDTTLSDKERLAAADAVSIDNKKRNDLIDKIDELIDFSMKVSIHD